MNYREALDYLGQSRLFGMKPGLERMRRVVERLGRPQDGLRFIHIAGTNGKGSTAAFCESILRASGFRVGLYTSPHLVTVRERIQINREPISEADFAHGMEAVRAASEEVEDSEITFFEITTALALWYFAREKVDWVVWETGLGGRLDATNIVTPQVCIITNIGLEHQQYLGTTLAEIAAEKAGILKRGVPLVSAVKPGEAFDVISRQADMVGCYPIFVHRDMKLENLGMRGSKQMARIDELDVALGLVGPHQIENAACAVEAMWKIRGELVEAGRASKELHVLESRHIRSGLENTSWPGRFEIISEEPLIVLDGAHNPSGMKMLAMTWREFLGARFGWNAQEVENRTRLVFGSVADKNIREMAQLLRPLAHEVLLVRLANERSADPKELAPLFAGLPCDCYESVADAWAKVEAAPESITLVTGSLFLVGEMLARRQGVAEEYRLNERLEKHSPTR